VLVFCTNVRASTLPTSARSPCNARRGLRRCGESPGGACGLSRTVDAALCSVATIGPLEAMILRDRGDRLVVVYLFEFSLAVLGIVSNDRRPASYALTAAAAAVNTSTADHAQSKQIRTDSTEKHGKLEPKWLRTGGDLAVYPPAAAQEHETNSINGFRHQPRFDLVCHRLRPSIQPERTPNHKSFLRSQRCKCGLRLHQAMPTSRSSNSRTLKTPLYLAAVFF